MGLFGRKKKEEPEMSPLPTVDTLHKEHGLEAEIKWEMPHHENPIPEIMHSDIMPKIPPAKEMPELPPLPDLDRQYPQPRQSRPAVQQQEPVMQPERPVFAPLFVNIDRYRNILNALGYMRTSLIMIRNSFATLNELEKARNETLKLIQEAIEKLDKKLATLDSELIRPAGYHSDTSPEYQDVETVQATVADLKGQIEQLKSELEREA